MAHTYTNCLYHCVWSTKQRQPFIREEIRERLWAFIGGIARNKGFRALEVGGHVDHAHALISLPPTVTVADALRLMKGGSSKFASETFDRGFEWQEGYSAFTIGISAVKRTITYIRNQAEHHRKKSFHEEYIEFLKRNGVAYDTRYVF